MPVPAIVIYVGGIAVKLAYAAVVEMIVDLAVKEAVKELETKLCATDNVRRKKALEGKIAREKNLRARHSTRAGAKIVSDHDSHKVLNRSAAWQVHVGDRKLRIEFDELMPESIKENYGTWKKHAMKVPYGSKAIRVFDLAGKALSHDDPFVKALVNRLNGRGGSCEVLRSTQLLW